MSWAKSNAHSGGLSGNTPPHGSQSRQGATGPFRMDTGEGYRQNHEAPINPRVWNVPPTGGREGGGHTNYGIWNQHRDNGFYPEPQVGRRYGYGFNPSGYQTAPTPTSPAGSTYSIRMQGADDQQSFCNQVGYSMTTAAGAGGSSTPFNAGPGFVQSPCWSTPPQLTGSYWQEPDKQEQVEFPPSPPTCSLPSPPSPEKSVPSPKHKKRGTTSPVDPVRLREIFKRDSEVPQKIDVLLQPYISNGAGPSPYNYSKGGENPFTSVFESVLNAPKNLKVLQSEAALKLGTLPIHQQLESLVTCQLLSLSFDQLRIRWQLCLDLFTILNAYYPQVKITPVGALKTGYLLASAEHPPDLRILLELKRNGKHEGAHSLRTNILKCKSLLGDKTCVYTGKKFLKFSNNCKHQSIEFIHLTSGLNCCLNFVDSVEVRRDQLIERCLSKEPGIQVFVAVLQYWAELEDIFGKKMKQEGTLEEYALFLMAVTFLMEKGALDKDDVLKFDDLLDTEEIRGCERYTKATAVQVLNWLEDFFERFGNVDFSEVAVCPLKGKLVVRKELLKVDEDTVKAFRSAGQKKHELLRDMEVEVKEAAMIIQDPMSPCDNVWGSRSKEIVLAMQKRFRMAKRALKETLTQGLLTFFTKWEPEVEESDNGSKFFWEGIFEMDENFVNVFMRRLEAKKVLEALQEDRLNCLVKRKMFKLWREFTGGFVKNMMLTGLKLKEGREQSCYLVTYPFWRNRTQFESYPEGRSAVEMEQEESEKVLEGWKISEEKNSEVTPGNKRIKLEVEAEELEKVQMFSVAVEGILIWKMDNGMPGFKIKISKVVNPENKAENPQHFQELVGALSQIFTRAFQAQQTYQLSVLPSLD